MASGTICRPSLRRTWRVMTHRDLLHRDWGPNNSSIPRVVRTLLMRLRQKLGEAGENSTYIFSEPGVEYKMAEARKHNG